MKLCHYGILHALKGIKYTFLNIADMRRSSSQDNPAIIFHKKMNEVYSVLLFVLIYMYGRKRIDLAVFDIDCTVEPT